MKTIFLAALLLALLAPAGGMAQPGPEQRIEAVRRRAAELSIPVALVDGKVAEGRAKGIPAERIAAAVEHRLDMLSRARQAMGPRGAAPADLSVGADALESGVDPEVLKTLAAQAPPAQRAMAIAVLSQLVRGGESSEKALEQVKAAMGRGPEALRALPGEAAARGAKPNGPPGPAGNPGNQSGRGNAGGRGGPPASVPAPGEGRGRGRGNGKP